MPLRWVQGCGRQNGLSQHVEGVAKIAGGFLLTIVTRCCYLLTKFLGIGLLLLRLSLQGESRFLAGEIELGLKDFEIRLVFLLVNEDEAALVISTPLLHLALYLIQLLTYLSSR